MQVFQASHLKGVLLDWAGRVANLGCVRRVVVVVSRLVKGRLRSVTPLTLLHQSSSILTSISTVALHTQSPSQIGKLVGKDL